MRKRNQFSGWRLGLVLFMSGLKKILVSSLYYFLVDYSVGLPKALWDNVL